MLHYRRAVINNRSTLAEDIIGKGERNPNKARNEESMYNQKEGTNGVRGEKPDSLLKNTATTPITPAGLSRGAIIEFRFPSLLGLHRVPCHPASRLTFAIASVSKEP